MRKGPLILAGGGTGGHLFPGLAVADELVRRHPGRQVVVIGTGRAVERRAVAAAGYRLRQVSTRPLRGRNMRDQALSLISLPWALAQAAALLARLRPAAVIGLGGYASGPVVLAAAAGFIPTAIMEQNSVPGSTNRILGRLRLLRRAYLTYASTARFFAPDTVRVLGNPVRHALVDVVDTPIDRSRPSILVLGGSQGAQRLNLSVPEALALAEVGGRGLTIVHQSGDAMAEAVRRRYDELGLSAKVLPFIDDMARAYREASLVVGRAGATTLAELAVVGRPSILVPYPHAIDDHQTKNARELEQAGAAIVVSDRDATPETLAARLAELLDPESERLGEMAAAAAGEGRPEATEQVVSDLEELIGVRQR